VGDIGGFNTYICFKEAEMDKAKHFEILGENDSCYNTVDLLAVLWKSRNHYHFHKSPPPDVAYSNLIPVHNFTLCNIGCILILSGDEMVKSVKSV